MSDRSSDQNFVDRNVVVVGGSHGIGLAIVQRLILRGAAVTVLSRQASALAGFEGVRHIAIDVTAQEFATESLPERIDGLVYCPGSINLGMFRSVKVDTMREDFELNVIGAVKVIQAALPNLKLSPAASIVLFSTVAVGLGLPMHTSVAAAKGAVEGVMRSLAAELAPKIRVNCLAPALVDTPLSERLLSSDKKREAMSEVYPLKRVGNVDDIAAMAELLLSDQGSWITGQVIGIDGGLSRVRG